MEKFVQDFIVPSYMVDARRKLRASSFMEIAQELAGRGAEQLHMADRDLASLDAVWVLARMHVSFVDTPVRGQEVTLGTWHKGLKGIQYVRDYSMTDAAGRPLVLSSSSWIIMHMKERRMLRPELLADFVPSEPQCDGDAVKDPCAKILLPKGVELESAGEHIVRYSDVDYNGHTNNTKYVVWALDALPQELVFNHDLKEMDINYNKESHPCETVTLQSVHAGGEWFVEGCGADGQQCFIARFLFAGDE